MQDKTEKGEAKLLAIFQEIFGVVRGCDTVPFIPIRVYEFCSDRHNRICHKEKFYFSAIIDRLSKIVFGDKEGQKNELPSNGSVTLKEISSSSIQSTSDNNTQPTEGWFSLMVRQVKSHPFAFVGLGVAASLGAAAIWKYFSQSPQAIKDVDGAGSQGEEKGSVPPSQPPALPDFTNETDSSLSESDNYESGDTNSSLSETDEFELFNSDDEHLCVSLISLSWRRESINKPYPQAQRPQRTQNSDRGPKGPIHLTDELDLQNFLYVFCALCGK